MSAKTTVQRSAFGVGAIVGVVGNMPIEPLWLKAVLTIVVWLGGTYLYLRFRPSNVVQ